MLQTRNGKRTAAAALKIACDLVDEGMISEEEALLMIDAEAARHCCCTRSLTPAASERSETPSASAASRRLRAPRAGKIVFTAEDAVEWGQDAARKWFWYVWKLLRKTSRVCSYAQGILTVRGGMTSHAAVVARGMGTCCVSGCGDIHDGRGQNKHFTLAGKTYHEGDWISLDGSTGNIYEEAIATVPATISGEFGRIMDWADKYQ